MTDLFSLVISRNGKKKGAIPFQKKKKYEWNNPMWKIGDFLWNAFHYDTISSLN